MCITVKMEGLCVRSIIVLFLLFSFVIGSKYSKESNLKQKVLENDRPFRMNKINLLWEKAQKRLGKAKLSTLYNDLLSQDKLELEAKRKRADGDDEEGDFEAHVRNEMLAILEKFDLKDPTEKSNRVDSRDIRKNDKEKVNMEKVEMDERLSKLWDKAQMSGFSDEELKDLKKEFMHHQQKLEEFNQLKNEINVMEDISDNSIDPMEEGDSKWENAQKKKQDLKKKHRSLKDSYMYIEGRIKSQESDDMMQFSEDKVERLWQLAQKANFDEVELQSFKEELEHFEHKLKKHRHFHSEMEMVKSELGKSDNQNVKHSEKHKNLAEKVKDYGFKVKKLYTHLKDRLGKALGDHSEL